MTAEDALQVINEVARKIIVIETFSEIFLYYKYLEQLSKSYKSMTIEQAKENFSIFTRKETKKNEQKLISG